MSAAMTTALPTAELSHAQLCNKDVFHEIFSYLDKHADLLSAALVSQTWHSQVCRQLYRTIHFDTSRPEAKTFDAALRSRPALRTCVRNVVLCHKEGADPELYRLFDWLALLPEHGLTSVDFQHVHTPETTDIDILEYPAIRTVSEVKISCKHFFNAAPERLHKVFGRPHLKSLEFKTATIPESYNGPYPDLTSLTILVDTKIFVEIPYRPACVVYTPASNLLTAPVLSHLESLSISASISDFEDCDSTTRVSQRRLLGDIQRHLPNLTHLAIYTMSPTFTGLLIPRPFFDTLILSLHNIRSLACGTFTFSSALFPLLPPSLDHLTLVTHPYHQPTILWPNEAIYACASSLPRLRALGAHLPARLTIVEMTLYHDRAMKNRKIQRYGPRMTKYLEELARVCEDCGVEFDTLRSRGF